MKLKNFGLTIVLTANILSAEANANQSKETCGIPPSIFIRKSIKIIEQSRSAEINLFSCDELKRMAELNANTLAITSGRKRGKYIICLSDVRNNPCKIHLGTFKQLQNPSKMLSDLFGIKAEENGPLNETVERLFLTPSSLIK